MTQKNETPALLISLLITLGLIGAGVWWFLRNQSGGVGISPLPLPQTSTAPNSNPASTPANPSAPATQSGADFTTVQNVPSGLFSYGGSTTWAPIRGQIDPLFRSAFPQFQLRYIDPPGQPPGSSTGIQMLLDGQLAIAQSSRPLQPAEFDQAKQRGFTITQIPVALEGIAIAVHPDLAIPGLTIDQLKGIYSGQLTNWNQVGGSNLPITAYSRQDQGGTVEFFIANVLGGGSFGSNVRYVSNTTQALRDVSNDLGGIYYASAPEVVGQCTTKPLPLARQPNEFISPYLPPLVLPSQCPAQRNRLNSEAFKSGQYPLTRTLFVIAKQNGQTEQQAGEAYANLLLTQTGQAALAEAGFVPIR